MPSVIIKGGTRKKATPTPLTKPIHAPTRRPAKHPMIIASQPVPYPDHKATIVIEATTEVIARITPTEKSKPAVNITII